MCGRRPWTLKDYLSQCVETRGALIGWGVCTCCYLCAWRRGWLFFGLHGGRDGSWCLYVYGEAVIGLVLMDVGVELVGRWWSLGGQLLDVQMGYVPPSWRRNKGFPRGAA
jgi:hypothetical protein